MSEARADECWSPRVQPFLKLVGGLGKRLKEGIFYVDLLGGKSQTTGEAWSTLNSCNRFSHYCASLAETERIERSQKMDGLSILASYRLSILARLGPHTVC